MKALNKEFKNASVTLIGGVGALMIIGNLIRREDPWNGMAFIPGLSFLMGLGWPVLCIWAGMLLRQWFKNPRWWVQALIVCATVFFLYKSRHSLAWWDTEPFLYLMCVGVGYLVPEGLVSAASSRKGWEYLMLLLAAAFCFTAMSVVSGRLQWHPWAFGAEHEDMKSLTQRLLLDCEPLLVLLAGYFAVMFSYSQAGQWLGGRDWFRGISAVLVIIMFLASLSNSFQLGFRHISWTYFPRTLVSFGAVFLYYRLWKDERKAKQSDSETNNKERSL